MRRTGLLLVAFVAACGHSTGKAVDGGDNDGSATVGALSVVDLSSWKATTCAVLSDGHVGCWGANADGEVGDGTTTDALTPRLVVGLTTAKQISLGATHACARVTDGTVRCWGSNFSGELGDGTKTSSPSPVTVVGVAGATQVVAGGIYSCALLADATVTCWGGLGSPGPKVLTGFTGVTAIDGDYRALCGLKTDATVICTDETPAVTGVAELALGDASRCVRLADGTVSCWGENTEGELGDGTKTTRAAPGPVPGLSGVTDLASGQFHRCALRTGPTDVVCWGEDSYGELGDGMTTDVPSPTPLTSLPGGASRFALGDEHSCAISANGGVYCWGRNNFGQLGDSTTTDHGTPMPIALPKP
jgi:alpha-tubulin suppressor-like RCC1 family protein